jgi:hypothetical protein
VPTETLPERGERKTTLNKRRNRGSETRTEGAKPEPRRNRKKRKKETNNNNNDGTEKEMD